MAKITTKHDIDEGLYIYKQSNSKRWYARFVIDGTWYSKATKQKAKDKAIVKAIQIKTEFTLKLNNNIPVHTTRKTKAHTFKPLAELAIKRMEDAIENGTGMSIFETYIRTLRKYHIPFFGDMHIRDTADAGTLLDFDAWRTKQLGRVPAKSSINTYNTAMLRVYDEALIIKCITQSEIPVLSNTGRGGERRSAFTKDEYEQLVKAAWKWVELGKKQITRDIRKKLYYYIQLAVLTGIRPGTELDGLIWEDFNLAQNKNDKDHILITVRTGKTTQHTGTRNVVGKHDLWEVLQNLIYEFRKRDNKSVFGNTGEFGRNFTKLLNALDMKSDAHGERTLYSLRHSYITWEIQKGTNISAIAKQCGTSIEMIERHYSHVLATDFLDQLSS